MISYEPPKQEAFGVGDYIEGLGTVLDPDDEEVLEFMEGVSAKDDTDYIKGNDEPHAHLNACGTGELTVFIEPSKVTTLTLMGDEVKHYDLVEKPTSEQRCIFCGCGRDECYYMVQSPVGPCICDKCAITVIHLMLEKGAER